MRTGLLIALAALALAACGQGAPNAYPQEAKTHFESTCPPESEVCVCTWARITRAMTYDEYQAALARMLEQGLMDPRVTRARGACLEQHPS